MKKNNQITLDKEELPKKYYNLAADLPEPLAPPKGNLDILGRIFSKSILQQEMLQENTMVIPEDVRDLYSLIGRPTPLYRAARLEKKLKTPAKIFFKREDTTMTGSHKINTAIPQAYFIKKDGMERVTTETGAGQWGSALALSSEFFGLDLNVFMVKASFEQKPHRKTIMNMYNANVYSSPSNQSEAGRKMRKEKPDHPGSLGIAISEAIELAKDDPKTVYSLGSVLNHVLMHQSIIGLEAMKQFESIGLQPDKIIGCVGGGSNFGGLAYPFMRDKLKGKLDTEFIAVEPVEVPTLTKGEYRYDYGDEMGFTPELMMYTLGHTFVPPPIFAGGLRYHGVAPSMAHLVNKGLMSAEGKQQLACFEAAKLFAETEGIIVAPESSHAVRSAIDHALQAKKENREETIVFNLSGNGLLDLNGYESMLSNFK